MCKIFPRLCNWLRKAPKLCVLTSKARHDLVPDCLPDVGDLQSLQPSCYLALAHLCLPQGLCTCCPCIDNTCSRYVWLVLVIQLNPSPP